MLKAFPKIFAIGTSYTQDLFSDPVQITEKVDGSQFVFGKINGKMYYRSKGKEQYVSNPDKMFACGINYIESIQDRLPEGLTFYGELLKNPKHNVLNYGRIPKNNIALFGVAEQHGTRFWTSHNDLVLWADTLEIEAVPCIYEGVIKNPDTIIDMLKRESFLGNVEIEGVVVKNYHRSILLGGMVVPVLAGKYVSEKFKEVHRKNWKGEKTSKGKWELFKEGYRTEARWAKAVQHLADKGVLANDPRDIGILIKEVKRDIVEEEQEEIKNFLWREFGEELLRRSTAGLPEWYKETLLKKSFEKEENNASPSEPT